jgi:hypothetical protein
MSWFSSNGRDADTTDIPRMMDIFIQEKEGPEGSGRKTFRLWTRCSYQWARWDLNKNLFESKWLGFRHLLLEVSGYVSREKRSKLRMVR